MFPVDSLQWQYCEERERAAEAARQLAQENKKAAEAVQAKAPVATRQASPSSLAQALHAPPMTRTGSSGVLGNILQGVMRAASNTPSPAASIAPSRTQTPALLSSAERDRAELEATKRDTDICALPGWH